MAETLWLKLSEAVQRWTECVPSQLGQKTEWRGESNAQIEFYTEPFQKKLNDEFSAALSVPEFSIQGAKVTVRGGNRLGPLEDIPASYFVRQRTLSVQARRDAADRYGAVGSADHPQGSSALSPAPRTPAQKVRRSGSGRVG